MGVSSFHLPRTANDEPVRPGSHGVETAPGIIRTTRSCRGVCRLVSVADAREAAGWRLWRPVRCVDQASPPASPTWQQVVVQSLSKVEACGTHALTDRTKNDHAAASNVDFSLPSDRCSGCNQLFCDR